MTQLKPPLGQADILRAFANYDAMPGDPYANLEHILSSTFSRTELNSLLPLVFNMSASWHLHLPLIDIHGDSGAVDRPPAEHYLLEARLTEVGALALGSRWVPELVQLVNGNLHTGGDCPGFPPERVLAATRLPESSDAQICEAVGPPAHPGNCVVEGDFSALSKGQRTSLKFSARLAVSDRRINVTCLPPGSAAASLVEALKRDLKSEAVRSFADGRPPFVRNESSVKDRVTVTYTKKTNADALLRWIEAHELIQVGCSVALPAPLPNMIRNLRGLSSRPDEQVSITDVEQVLGTAARSGDI